MDAPVRSRPSPSGNDDGPPFSWEDVARLAAHAFGVPFASLRVREEWAAVGTGEEVSPAELRTICRQLRPVEAPVVVEDAAADDRLTGLRPRLRFVVAAPVRDVGRQPVGELCLADTNPRTFSGDEVVHLQTLAGLAAAHLYPLERPHSPPLERIIQQAEQGVIVTDLQGRIRWANEGFTKLCGYTFEELYDRRPRDLLQGPATDPGTLAAVRERVRAGEGFVTEIVNYRKSGEPYWVRIEAEPIATKDGTLVGFIAFETDVSARKA